MRASVAEYRRLDLRAHELLRDVSLYDVSSVDLPGGGSGRTIADIRRLESAAPPSHIATFVYGLRYLLGRVFALPPSKAELDNLRSIVARSLKDVTSAGLSADYRFVMAYDAARTLSLLVVRACGYRPRTIGGHYNTFLEAADPTFAQLSALFDSTRHTARRLLARLDI